MTLRWGKTKIITAIVPIIILRITIWWYFEYQNRAAYRAFSTQMLKEDCFEVDAQLTKDNELLNDPKVFDCSKDILGNFKPTILDRFQTLEEHLDQEGIRSVLHLHREVFVFNNY